MAVKSKESEPEEAPEAMVTEPGVAAVKSLACALPGDTASGTVRAAEAVVPAGREAVTVTEWAAARSVTSVCAPAVLLSVSTAREITASSSVIVIVSGSAGTRALAPPDWPVISRISSPSAKASAATVRVISSVALVSPAFRVIGEDVTR